MHAGDSVAAGQPDPSFAWHVSWNASVNAYLTGSGMTAMTFVNVGVGGSTTQDLAASIGADTTANAPDHIWIHCCENDQFNHGGSPLTPAQSASFAASAIAAAKAARPNVIIHWIEPCFYATEARPDGAGPNDAAVAATVAAVRPVVQATANCEWLPIRARMRGELSLAYNPTNLSTGALTQGGDGTHPSKTAGQQAFDTAMFALTTFGI